MKKFSWKSKDGKDKKKKVMAMLAALCLILVLAGTFAWTSYTDWVKNHMQSLGFSQGDVTIVEDFDPDDPIKPGGKIKKKVNVINSTPVEAFVRVSFEEELAKLGSNAVDATGSSKNYGEDPAKAFPVIRNAKDFYIKGSDWKDRTNDLTVDGGSAPAGLKLFVKANESVLIYEATINNTAFPENFIFTDVKFPIPVIPADRIAATYDAEATKALKELSDGNDVMVAQKVSAHIKRNATTDKFSVETNGGNDKTDLKYWNYGDKVGALAQADWAGVNVWVEDPTPITPAEAQDFKPSTTSPTSVVSQIADGPIIDFAKDNIYVGESLDFDFTSVKGDAWFYNLSDGYFYYLSALSSGAQTEATLMESISFPNNPTYNLAAYDLHLGSEAIPAQAMMLTAPTLNGAVTDSDSRDEYELTGKVTISDGSGFGLDKTNDKALFDYLKEKATINDDAKP